MTVQDLINELKMHPADREVHFAYNYGDHWHTRVAPKVSEVELGFVKHSTYHDMDAVTEDEEEQNDEAKTRAVLILS